MIVVHAASHVDHGLSPEQLDAAIQLASPRLRLPESGAAVVTVELPPELGTVLCALHGPAMGDAPVSDDEVAYRARPGREWPSRLCARPLRRTRLVTVVAGPHDGLPWVLFTAYPGPGAPREPDDPSLGGAEWAAASAFWRRHALTPLDATTRVLVALEVLTEAADAAVNREPYGGAHDRLERMIADARAVLREVGQ